MYDHVCVCVVHVHVWAIPSEKNRVILGSLWLFMLFNIAMEHGQCLDHGRDFSTS